MAKAEDKLYTHVGRICDEAYSAGKKRSGVFSPPVDDMAAIRAAFVRAEEAEVLDKALTELATVAATNRCPRTCNTSVWNKCEYSQMYTNRHATAIPCWREWALAQAKEGDDPG